MVVFVKGKYNIAYCSSKIMSVSTKEKQFQKWMWRKSIPWEIKDTCIFCGFLGSMIYIPDRPNASWEDPHRIKDLMWVILTVRVFVASPLPN